MKSECIVVESISVSHRMRAVDHNKVASLALSMGEIGLLSPILVHTADGETVTLVAGSHRLAAAKSLGWEEIDCQLLEGDDITCGLAEIDENLCRHELTPTEVAEHVAKRKELWEARQSDQLAPIESKREDGKGHRDEGFATETAKASGQSKASVNRAVKRGNEVCQEARDLIRGTKLDTGATLDELVKLEPAAQVERVNIRLEALADKERRDALKREREEREKEAKELREEARDECLNFLCTLMNGRDWARLIDLVERSGGSIRADQLRKWQSP